MSEQGKGLNTPIHKSGKIYRVDGTVEDFLTWKELPSLKEMQGVVGGYISRIKIAVPKGFTESCVMVFNEDGLPKKLPVNLEASMLAQQHIVGDVIVMPARLFK